MDLTETHCISEAVILIISNLTKSINKYYQTKDLNVSVKLAKLQGKRPVTLISNHPVLSQSRKKQQSTKEKKKTMHIAVYFARLFNNLKVTTLHGLYILERIVCVYVICTMRLVCLN